MKKSFIVLSVLLVCMFFTSTAALAQTNIKVEKFSPLPSSTGNLINYIDGTITQVDINLVAFEAITDTNTTVDTLTQTIYLQKLSGSSWITVETYPETKYNVSFISYNNSAYVTKGDTYRLKVISKATAGVTDTREAYSDPIKIQ
ncbi:MAG: hypothetical protein VR72_21585 [Clostridiaceae bacterium BRH_c20a]|nr:MAG: hypothetical protein VR72_21585 [Clostridiaceae bacterium BRH_c20a]